MLHILKKNSWNYFYLLVFSTFLIIFLKKINSIHIEPIDFDLVHRILNPNGPKGDVGYNPYFHFSYILAFVEKFLFVHTQNFKISSTLVWVISEIFVSIVLIKISLFLFKNDTTTAFFIFVLYISFRSGQIDQKTMANPFFLLSIYYFLLSKLILCGIFLGIVFYLHMGLGLWLGIPISIAILYLYTKNSNLFNFKEIIYFFLTTSIITSPLLYFYFFRGNVYFDTISNNPLEDPFVKEFWYGIHNSTIDLLTNPKPLIQFLVLASVVAVGVLTRFGNFKDNKIFALVIGVLGLFFINFILCDIFSSGPAMMLQLLRSEILLKILALIFFCYLIVNQIRKKNILFFLIFCLIVIPNPLLVKYNYWTLQLFFYCVLSIYVFFEILKVIPNDIFLLNKKIKLNFITKFYNNISLFLNNSNKLMTVLFVLLLVQKIVSYTSINQEIKNMFESHVTERVLPYVSQVDATNEELIGEESQKSSLYGGVLDFANAELSNKETLLLSPFTDYDFVYLVNCKTLFGPSTIFGYYPGNFEIFKDIVLNDFKYSIKDIQNINFWETLWHKINENLLIKWNQTYGLTHIVMEKNIATFKLPVIYEDKFYRIYDLR